MRVVRRAVRARRTALPFSDSPRSHDSRAVASPCAESPEVGEAGDEQPFVARPDEDSSAPVPRGAGVLSVCPSLVAKAEARAVPGLFEDFTDGGFITVSDFVARFDWSSSFTAQQARTWARTLDIAYADDLAVRSPRTWACLVCPLGALYLEEQNPTFRRVRQEAAKLGFFFPAYPSQLLTAIVDFVTIFLSVLPIPCNRQDG